MLRTLFFASLEVALKRAVLFSESGSVRCLFAGCTAAGTSDLLGLLGQKNGLDVGQHSTLSDGDTGQELVEFLVVADSQLKMTGNDASLLVVTSGVAGQLENFGCEVFHHSGQVDWSTSTDTFSVVSLAEQTVDTTDWELKTSTARSALCLSLDFASFTASRHDDIECVDVRLQNDSNDQMNRELASQPYLYACCGELASSLCALIPPMHTSIHYSSWCSRSRSRSLSAYKY
jgi:hypothetical protein